MSTCYRLYFNNIFSNLQYPKSSTTQTNVHLFNKNVLFLENLQYLRLGDNNLHQISSDALRPLHRLRHLDLRSNNISIIPEDAFVGYGDSITFLNLQKNE